MSIKIKKILKTAYRNIPEDLQYFLGGIYANTFRSYTFGGGRAFRRYWDEFSETEYWDREELEKLQWEKFKKLLSYSYENVCFYRNRFKQVGITPEDIKSFDDLTKIPMLTKKDIRNHLDDLIADRANKEDLIVHETSGSTGTPLTIYYDKQCYIAIQAAYARWKEFAGCNAMKDKFVYIGRHDFPEGSDGSDFWGEYLPLSNELKLASTNMTPKVLGKYVERIRNFEPKYIQGYASGVYVLAYYIHEMKSDMKVDAVLTSSDALYPKYREIIEGVFKCKVFDRYGSIEDVATAVECEEHNGMHIDMEKCLIEIIDDSGNQLFGKTGEIIGTNLENYAMPLIRYRTNDLGSLNLRECSCGRKSILLDKLEGRKDDFIVAPDGRIIGSSGITVLLEPIKRLKECQIIQNEIESIEILTVWEEGYSQIDIDDLVNAFQHDIGTSLELNIEVVDSIPRSRGGKFKFVISNLSSAENLSE